jgi:DNA mismatch endonuclease (patch repair protein)
MSRIRRRDTRPEWLLRRALHARGWRYFVDRPVRGVSRCRPDLSFPRLRVAVFVDGCFWHFCPPHTHLPRANAAYWQAKLLANRQRDARHDAELAGAGWRVVRVWEHDAVEQAVAAVEAVLVAARAENEAAQSTILRTTADRPRRAR